MPLKNQPTIEELIDGFPQRQQVRLATISKRLATTDPVTRTVTTPRQTQASQLNAIAQAGAAAPEERIATVMLFGEKIPAAYDLGRRYDEIVSQPYQLTDFAQLFRDEKRVDQDLAMWGEMFSPLPVAATNEVAPNPTPGL